MSTIPLAVIESVTSPSTSSLAVTPGSVKVSPTVRLIVEEPNNEITGGVVSAVAAALTVKVPVTACDVEAPVKVRV